MIQICPTPSSASMDNAILGGTTTLSHTLIGGINRLLLVFWYERNATVPAVTYNGIPMSLLFSQAGQLANDWLNCYYLLESSLPAAGAYNVVPSGSGRGYGQLGAISFSNVSQRVADLLVSSGNTGNGNTVATQTISTINDALLILWGGVNVGGATWTPTSPAVEWADNQQVGTTPSSAGGVYRWTTAGGNTTIATVSSSSGYVTAGAVGLRENQESLGLPIWF